jgi:hypothetical protein
VSTLPSTKLDNALLRAFKKHEATTYAADAAIVAGVVMIQHGDEAGRVLELAAKIAREAVADLDARKGPADPDGAGS